MSTTDAEKIARMFGAESSIIARQLSPRTCPECGRVFDPLDPTDAEELTYGHDCEG